MFSKHRNGMISESLAEVYFLKRGYNIFKPQNDFCGYDMIVDDGEKLLRVQIKTIYFDMAKQRYLGSCVTSHIRGHGRRTNKKYTANDFDLWCFISEEYNVAYVIPQKEIANRRSITFYPNGKPETVNDRYEDFEKFKNAI